MERINSESIGTHGVVLTPSDVELQMVELVEELDRNHVLLVARTEDYTTKKAQLDLAQAKAMLRAKGRSLDQRKAEVLVATEDLWIEVQGLEQQVRLYREASHNLRVEIDVCRSLGASVRAMYGTDGVGVGGGGGRRG